MAVVRALNPPVLGGPKQRGGSETTGFLGEANPARKPRQRRGKNWKRRFRQAKYPAIGLIPQQGIGIDDREKTLPLDWPINRD